MQSLWHKWVNIGIRPNHSLLVQRRIKILNTVVGIITIGIILIFLKDLVEKDPLGLIISSSFSVLIFISIDTFGQAFI